MTIVACGAATGCGISSAPPLAGATSPTPQQISQFEDAAGIVVPVSTKVIYFREANGLDQALWLSFEFPKQGLPEWLSSPPLDQVDWRLEEPERRRNAQFRLPNAEVLNVNLEDVDETDVIVELMWHQT